jgi:hypothetical protein
VKALFDAETLADPLFGQRAEQLTIHDFARLTWKMKTQPPLNKDEKGHNYRQNP